MELTGHESRYYQYKGTVFDAEWKEVPQGIKNSFFGKVLSEADLNFSNKSERFMDLYDNMELLFDALKICGAVVMIQIMAEIAVPYVAANVKAVVYYCQIFGIREGLKMYTYLGTEKLPNGLIDWIQKNPDKQLPAEIPRGLLIGKLDKLTQDERNMLEDLLTRGFNVRINPRSNVNDKKTADFFVDGVLTELKTLNGESLNTPVTKIQRGFKQHASTVILDARKTKLTKDQALQVLVRINGKYKNKIPGKIEIWTKEGIIYGGQ